VGLRYFGDGSSAPSLGAMSEFLVELYVPKSDPTGIEAGVLRLRRAAAGTPIRVLQSIVVPDDETCFLLVKAATVEAVLETARRAALPVERVVEATEALAPHTTTEGGAVATATETIRNGVDTEVLYGTLDAIKSDPSIAKFQFRARNQWIDGAHNRTIIRDFYAANQEDTSRTQSFIVDAGEPAILLGTDTGPNPAEYLLHALAACLTTSLVYVAAARGVKLTEVESTLEGDMDVQGALGLSDDHRNGFEQIRVMFRVKGEAPAEKLREVVERARLRSAVFDMVSNGVPVSVDVETA
jgi:uncharacterized OsmC-like protein